MVNIFAPFLFKKECTFFFNTGDVKTFNITWHFNGVAHRKVVQDAPVIKSRMLTNAFGFLFGLGIVLADLNTRLPVEFHP